MRPDDAERDVRYRCPGCGEDVVLRRGERTRAHFAHRGGESCRPESVLHRAGKREVLRVIREWKETGGPRPCIARLCPRYGCEGGITQDVPDDITHADEEVKLADGSVADVVLFRRSDPAAAVEIRVTHGVGHVKARRMDVPWVELLAEDLLERPYWWVPVQDGLKPFRCPICARRQAESRRALAAVWARAEAAARASGQHLPPSPPYHYAPHECWRCGVRMAVLLWPGSGGVGDSSPPEPIPPTLQRAATGGLGGVYWANCCPKCSAVQGDYHLREGNEDYRAVLEYLEEVEG